jgi:hypothetical protein
VPRRVNRAGQEAGLARADARAERLEASQVTAVGAFERATVGWFDRTARQYRRIPVDEQCEVLSEPGKYRHVVVGVLAEELARSVLKGSRNRWEQRARPLAGPVQRPLASVPVVQAEGQPRKPLRREDDLIEVRVAREILEPAELREQAARTIRAMAAVYGQPARIAMPG